MTSRSDRPPTTHVGPGCWSDPRARPWWAPREFATPTLFERADAIEREWAAIGGAQPRRLPPRYPRDRPGALDHEFERRHRENVSARRHGSRVDHRDGTRSVSPLSALSGVTAAATIARGDALRSLEDASRPDATRTGPPARSSWRHVVLAFYLAGGLVVGTFIAIT